MQTADNGATILAGNQKVLFARLADAKFFWENDLRVAEADAGNGMKPWFDKLRAVTFHNKLGTQAELISRMSVLAREVAPNLGADPAVAEQAALVAKVDLASEMVYEFPELQGVMGRYYLKHARYNDDVADAARDHYAPLGPSDDVPTAPVSAVVSLAEKIDKLTGFWAIDEKPTGSKDPFALRRAALGVIRLVLENDASVQLRKVLMRQTLATLIMLGGNSIREKGGRLGELLPTEKLDPSKAKELAYLLVDSTDSLTEEEIYSKADLATTDLLSFFHDRLKVFLKDKGIRHDIIDACIAMPGNDDLTLLVKRAEALAATLATDDGENLIQGFKRANNFLTQAEEKDGVEYSYGADIKFAEDDAEKALFAALDAADAKIAPAMAAEDFSTAMAAMAALRGPIDAFVDNVKVNADSQILRRNRLNLLSRIRNICLSVADLTKIDG
jgi:glycyl-tRNA synthetase beta chain